MKYNAKTKGFSVTAEEMKLAAGSFYYALRHIRQLAGLPLDRYKSDGPLDHAAHAQRGILDAAKTLGIDLGAEWGEDLDLREDDDIPEPKAEVARTEGEKDHE